MQTLADDDPALVRFNCPDSCCNRVESVFYDTVGYFRKPIDCQPEPCQNDQVLATYCFFRFAIRSAFLSALPAIAFLKAWSSVPASKRIDPLTVFGVVLLGAPKNVDTLAGAGVVTFWSLAV